jgi:hypothetical protein
MVPAWLAQARTAVKQGIPFDGLSVLYVGNYSIEGFVIDIGVGRKRLHLARYQNVRRFNVF